MKRILAFDLGKASIGYCVREDNEIKCANSIIIDKILSGNDPFDIDISEFVDKPDTKNPITEEEINQMLLKIGNWDNLYIGDNRDENANDYINLRTKTDVILSSITS